MTPASRFDDSLEAHIGQWRQYLAHRQAIHAVDVAELEDHLREQVEGLRDSGLSDDEAFLVAVKRMGDLDTLSREFAVEHSARLWKQLVVPVHEVPTGGRSPYRSALVVLGLAILIGVLIRIGVILELEDGVYARNASLFVLPVLAGYFAWKQQISGRLLAFIGGIFLGGLFFANRQQFTPDDPIQILIALHLPVVLWLGVGMAYAGVRWRESAGRMDFVRFSGELGIYYVLIALGGGMLMGMMALIFEAIGVSVDRFFAGWVPSLAGGAVLIASWLVEGKKSVIENMAPVLTRLFTPLVTIVLLSFLGVALARGGGLSIERDALLAFDLLLLLVLVLVLYSLSARDTTAPVDWADKLQLLLLVSALLVDVIALTAILARISEWGFTPNRTAVLGLNLILLVNLLQSTRLYFALIRGTGSFAALEKWQTRYLPVYAGWAAIVVVIFPFLFS